MTSSHFYFYRWDIKSHRWHSAPMAEQQDERTPGTSASSRQRPSILQLMKVLKSLPRDEVILTTRSFDNFEKYLEAVEEEPSPGAPQRIFAQTPSDDPETIRHLSCQQQTPFRWVILDTPQQRQRFQVLDRDFSHRSEERNGYRIFHITQKKSGGCSFEHLPAK
jgi:hypothetical protein